MSHVAAQVTPPTEQQLAPRLQHLPPHPRLFLKPGSIDALKASLKADPLLAGLWTSALAEADATITRPPPQHILEGKRLLGVSRDTLQRITFLGLAYRVTGEKKYLDAARQVLLTVAAFPDWNPSHFLDVGEMTAAVGIGYDWLYPDLSEADRATLRQAIQDKGFAPSFNAATNSWLGATNNWCQVCHGGLSLGALAIADDQPEAAAKIIARAVAGVPKAMHVYAPDGVYPEGPMYWGYGTMFSVLLIDALQTSLGTDFGLSQQPGFLASADYVNQMRGPTGKMFDYGDAREGGALSATPNAPLWWIASHRNDGSLLYFERAGIAQALKAGNVKLDHELSRVMPLAFLWAPPSSTTKPTTLYYTGQGEVPVAVYRTSYDPTATFIGIKAGSPSDSHAHMDAGSFVLDAAGYRWAADLGMQDYNSLESKGVNLWDSKQHSDRWQVFRIGPTAHNILTVLSPDGSPRELLVSAHATLKSTPTSTILDLSPLYAGDLASAHRGIALLAPGAVRLQDEFTAPPDKPATVRWTLLTPATADCLPGGALLHQGSQTLKLTFPNHPTLTPTAREARGPHDYDAPNPGKTLLTLDLPLKPGESATLIADLGPVSAPATPLAQWK